MTSNTVDNRHRPYTVPVKQNAPYAAAAGVTPLHAAVAKGDAVEVHALLTSKNTDINAKDYQGDTALHYAARQGHAAIITKFVKDFGADVNIRGSSQRTPLHFAALHGCIDSVLALTASGANMEAKCNSGITPLSLAFAKGHVDIVDMFAGIDKTKVNAKDYIGRTPLYYAITSRQTPNVRWLVEKCGADVNIKDVFGETPLNLAVHTNQIDVVEVLRDCGANFDEIDDDGQSLLLKVVGENNEIWVKTLLDCGADINFSDLRGNTSLHFASTPSMLRLLVERGANIKALDVFDNTVLHNAAYRGDSTLVEYILQIDSTMIFLENKNGELPLHRAVCSHCSVTVKVLLTKLDVDINAKDKDGSTPLHLAIIQEQVEIVRQLLESGSDAWSLNNKGETPSQLAMDTPNIKTILENHIASSIRIFCLLLGENATENTFPIEVDRNITIGQLKKILKDEKKPDLDDFAANKLQIFKVCLQEHQLLSFNANILDEADPLSPLQLVRHYFHNEAKHCLRIVFVKPISRQSLATSNEYPERDPNGERIREENKFEDEVNGLEGEV